MDILAELAKLQTPGEQITFLKNAASEQSAYQNGFVIPKNIAKYKNEYDVTKHTIFTDLARYPDKTMVTEYTDDAGVKQQTSAIVKLNRIGLPYQKKIVKAAVTFLFGNEVKYICNPEKDSEKTLFEAFTKVIEQNKMKFQDRALAESTSRFTQGVELWYTEPEDNTLYGFASKGRIKCKILTPDVYNFYPYFDENDDLVAFSREFTDPNDTKTIYFETYTADKIFKYVLKPETQPEVTVTDNALGKIPIVYVQQDDVEWADVQTGIERLECLYSNLAESNDKHAFPILWLKGKMTGQLQSTVARVMQLDEQAEIGYAIPANASESLKGEIERLERDVHDMTDTPNISFGNMVGLGNVLSGVGSKYLFMSAHLKTMDKMAIYIPALQRRISIVKAMLIMLNNKLKEAETLTITPEITPYIIDDENQKLKDLMAFAGDKPIMSQSTVMQKAGVNPEEEMKKIKEETPAQPVNVPQAQ